MVYIIISIDVEPDCTKTWNYSNPLTFNGVLTGINNILQPLFNKYNFPPTYLINNVVLEDENSVNVFRKLEGDFELGTHLHPEFIEPEKSEHNYAGSRGKANCCFYNPEIEFLKIQNITDLFVKKFGYRPLSFRAGRFSAGKNTIKSLSSLGYKVETSVTPNLVWDDETRATPVSYLNVPLQPYRVSESSFPQQDDFGSMIEVPVTIITKKLNVIERMVSFLKKPFKISPLKHVWLRPHYSTLNDLISIYEDLINNNDEEDDIFLNMMFHNVEVLPSISPYNLTQEDCDKYLTTLDAFLSFCSKNGAKGIKLSDVANLYK